MSHHECDQDLMSDAPHHRIPTSSEVASLENEVAAHSKTEHPEVADLLSDLIAAFPDAFATLDSPDVERPQEELVVMLFATKAFFSLRSATNLALKGNYAQAQVVNRLLMEECMLARYYHSRPDDAAEYLREDCARTPWMNDMLESLGLKHLYDDYELLSWHAHSRRYSTYPSAVSQQTGTRWVFRSAPEYVEALLLHCAAYSAKYGGEVLQFLAKLSGDAEVAARVRGLIQRVIKFEEQLEGR